jgi:hypothetical protein
MIVAYALEHYMKTGATIDSRTAFAVKFACASVRGRSSRTKIVCKRAALQAMIYLT